MKSEKSFAQQKRDGILCNVCSKPGELARNCPLKSDILMRKWFVETGKIIERKDNNSQKTTRAIPSSEDESSNDELSSDDE